MLRTVLLAAPLLVLAAVWAQVSVLHRRATDSVSPVPPPAAFGLFVPVLLFCVAAPVLRRRWRVTRAQLVALLFMLLLALPIVGPAFWFHFVPLQQEYHRMRDLEMAMSTSKNLWPNRGNLLAGVGPEVGGGAGVHWTHSRPERTTVTDEPDGPGQCVRIVHSADSDVSKVVLRMERREASAFARPWVRYAVFARLRLDGAGPSSSAALAAGTRADGCQPIAVIRKDTTVRVVTANRFAATGAIDYLMSRDLGDTFHLELTFSGKGTLYARDFTIVDTEETYRYLEGYKDAPAGVHEGLPAAEKPSVRARPENRWSLAYVRYVLFGLVPWRAWARPLAIWGLLVVGMFLAMFCLVTIFYRHWEDGDRLAFPLQTFVVELTAGDKRSGLALFRSSPFWIALVLCVLHLSLQQLNTHYPDVPCIRLQLAVHDVLPEGTFRDALHAHWRARAIQIDIRPMAVAVAFFVSIELSFSLVVFYLGSYVYQVIGYFTPLRTFRTLGDVGGMWEGFPFPELLAIGGLLFMPLFCVVSARRHLVRVVRKVFLGRNTVDDSAEAVPYRWAVAGLAVSAVLLLLFARFAEVSGAFVLVFLLVYLLLALSAARIRAETGIPHAGIMGQLPQYYLLPLGGALLFGYRQIVFTAQAAFLYAGTFLLSAPILAESMAAATRVGLPLRKLTRCLWAAFFIALVVGGLVSMSWAYSVGALNMHGQVAGKRYVYVRNEMVIKENNQEKLVEPYFRDHPDEPQVLTDENRGKAGKFFGRALVVAATSFVITGLLTLARVIWLGFPLHPLGFALAFTPAVKALWSSIALGCLVKHLGQRFGGVQFVRGVLRPFFVGLFLGDVLVSVVVSIVETLVRQTPAG